ncbi:MAG: pilin [Gammaproteobacteria bacterium]
MMTLCPPARFPLLGQALLLLAAICLAPTVSAQRPSVADLQAQIDALTFPYDEPAAQVRTALDLLPFFQEAVARSFRETGVPPADREAAGLTQDPADTQTSFIEGVDIINGSILFIFGNDADPTLTQTLLSFTPHESEDKTITWQCGDESQPANTVPLGTNGPGPAANYLPTTIPASAQPNPCILQSQPGGFAEIIRAQVLEPFGVLETIQDAVETAGAALGSPAAPQPPAGRTEAGLTNNSSDTSGRYFSDIDIFNGTITVFYGQEAHEDLKYQILSFTPYETPDGTIIWSCGFASPPQGSLMGSANGGDIALDGPTTVEPRYLPYFCREPQQL